MEDPSLCTNTVIPYDLGGYIWNCQSMCDESQFHGSGTARRYDFHRLCSNNHLLQHRHDTAGARQYGLNGCAVDSRQLAWTLSLPVAPTDVHCK